MKEYRDCNVSFRLTQKEMEYLIKLTEVRHVTKAVVIRDLLYREWQKEGYLK